jgi:hypothetical protein
MGAQLMPDYSGWWVYALGACDEDERPGHIWYAGQSESLLRRLDDHRRANLDLYDPRRVYLVKVRDEAQADLYELLLIDYYQPERCSAGRVEDLRRKVHGYGRGGRAVKPS